MDRAIQIKQHLKGFGEKPNKLLTATVTAVQENTCSVKLESGFEVTDVRLLATTSNGGNGFIIVPKIGSDVLVLSQTEGVGALVLIKCNEWEKVTFIKDDFRFEMTDKKKICIKNNQANLGTVFLKLFETLEKAVIQTPSGPGNFSPNEVATFTDLKQKINQLIQE